MRVVVKEITIHCSKFGNTDHDCFTVDVNGEDVYGLPMGREEVIELIEDLMDKGSYEDFED